MAYQVKTCCAACLLVLPFAASAQEIPTIEPTPVDERPAMEEPRAKDETERWVPSLAVIGGILVQQAEATAESGELTGSDPPEPVSPPADGDDIMVGPFVGASAELMTPGLSAVPGRPRFFLHGDVSGYFGPVRDIAREGAPEALPQEPQPPLTPEVSVPGQGSKTTAEVGSVVISAGAGVAFSFDAWQRRLRIKPSFEYLQEDVEVSGLVSRAVRLDQGSTDPPVDATYRFIEIRGREEKTYRGIGPGLEIEMDAARIGPFMLALFLSGQAYKMLGDLEVEFAGSSEGRVVGPRADDPEFQDLGTETATWSFEKDPWSFRGALGLRFRWLPQ
jgi:hypothetical protein